MTVSESLVGSFPQSESERLNLFSSTAMGAKRRNDRCYDYFKALLLDGGLEPGETIFVEKTRQHFQVSRAPVMEALKRLNAEGFVEIHPQVGCKVIDPTANDVENFYHLMQASEGVLVRLAAQRRTVAEAQFYAEFVKNLHKQANALRQNKAPARSFRLLNRQRFMVIHELAHAPNIAARVANMWDLADFYVRITFGYLQFDKPTAKLVEDVDTAIITGNADTAERAAHAFIGRAQRIVERLKSKETNLPSSA